MARRLSAVAENVSGRLIGADCGFGPVATDTRDLPPGSLFVAIRGDNFDGNDFVAEAHARGAAGALVSRPAEVPLPQVAVSDTRRAFGAMAKAWRENFDIPVVAVTGSAGKTTVKEMVAAIVSVSARACVTIGNLNNDIGVPLTLMRLEPDDDVLVVELGANHKGEIGYLAALVEATVGIITNAAAAHLEGFGSIQGVAAAKGELLDHLPRAGVSVLNADDPFYPEWRARARTADVVSFGSAATADCGLIAAPEFGPHATRFEMRLPGGEAVTVLLPLIGAANVANALAAAAAAQAVGASSADIRSGLEQMRPVRGRLTALAGASGSAVIDDSYNANPSAARAALDYLSELPGRRIFVLGDMAELGADAAQLHAELGRYARGRCDVLIAYGQLAAHAARAFGSAAESFAEMQALQAAVQEQLAEDVTVLVKGSRVMELERLVACLLDAPSGRSAPC